MQRFLRECVADVTGAAAPLTSRCVREGSSSVRILCRRGVGVKEHTVRTAHTARTYRKHIPKHAELQAIYRPELRGASAGDVTVSCLLIATLNISVLLGMRDQTNKPDYGVLKGKVTWLDRICCGFGY